MLSSRLSRRTLVVGSTAVAALFSTRYASAQVGVSTSTDWFAMVQAQHVMIAKTFDALLASKSAPRTGVLKALAYQLTAHSTAEENVLYPALVRNGLATEADKLYLDQAHAKVLNAELDMNALLGESGDGWMDTARTLQAAVLKHAKEDEEATLFPQLRSKLTASQNSILSSEFKLQFASVKPATVL